MRSMEELFYALLQDLYFAEKQLVKTLPKLAKNSANEKLQEAFINHYDETEEQVARLEKVFEAIGKRAPPGAAPLVLAKRRATTPEVSCSLVEECDPPFRVDRINGCGKCFEQLAELRPAGAQCEQGNHRHRSPPWRGEHGQIG